MSMSMSGTWGINRLPEVPPGHHSVLMTPEVATSGASTSTRWRRASCTSEWGDQKPIGWASSSPARNAAGSWYFNQAEAYTR